VVTGGIEAVGDAMTGALVARAVEPEAGEGRGIDQGACLNCGFELIGQYCHGCGQKAKVHRTLRSYGHDLLHGVFHFEGKVWKTLPMLAWRPGELTRRYIHGERAKFVSPLALFLFAVFLMFAVVGGLAGEMHLPNGTIDVNLRGKPLSELQAAMKAEQAKKIKLDAQIKAVDATDGNPADLYAERGKVENNIDGIETALRLVEGKAPVFTDIKTGIPRIDAGIAAANENPNLILYKLQTSAYKYSWALIPLSLPFVWLMFFWKRGYKLYDHAVFVTYSLTFMLFLVVVLTLAYAVGIGEPFVPLAAVFVPPLHMYRQIRGAYQTSRVGAILRTMILSVCGVLVLSLFMTLLLLLGVLG
jgi:Protein of unknown function (DUF3667)